MHFQYKGKRILVPVFAITPLIVSTLLTKAVEENFFEHKFHGNVYQVVLGIAILISGFWNNYVCNDYYYEDKGEKHIMDYENQFMWIEMKFFSYIFWVIGVLVLLGGTVEMLF